ncbi:MAG TPA: ABC transporter ATP-binding protein [Xanthobacteraceae bacterium]|nr:ABC transporter ATP-binding protein [Xanthobacteraceae bacterium]
MAKALLETEGLTKRFGGVIAADGISLALLPGELHAIIGPNGAGKSTLIGQLSGEIVPDSGYIHFDGRDITALPVYRRSRLGLARSLQVTTLFPDFTAIDNVALSVQAHAGHSFRFWRDVRQEADLREPARAALVRVGLGERATALVADLSHGERRQLEIAMALATRPRMLLLDEPMAGMGSDESARLVETLRTLKGDITVMLIEHDIDAVFALADRISVLVYGRIIACGEPAAIRADAAVREAYVGEG